MLRTTQRARSSRSGRLCLSRAARDSSGWFERNAESLPCDALVGGRSSSKGRPLGEQHLQPRPGGPALSPSAAARGLLTLRPMQARELVEDGLHIIALEGEIDLA